MADFISVRKQEENGGKLYRMTVTLHHWGLDKNGIKFTFDSHNHRVKIESTNTGGSGKLFEDTWVDIPVQFAFENMKANWISNVVYEAVFPLKEFPWPPKK